MWMGIHSHLLTRYDWMSREHGSYCWWFRNPKQPTEMVLKPCKYWKKLSESTSTGFDRRISEPSTGLFIVKKFLWSGDFPMFFFAISPPLMVMLESLVIASNAWPVKDWCDLVRVGHHRRPAPQKKTSKNIGRSFGGISPNCGLKTWLMTVQER